MEENKIQEAQTEPVKLLAEPTEELAPKKRKADLYIELALFLILGVLIGVAVKTEAVKRITAGFDDNKMKIIQADYDINKLQEEQAVKLAEEEKKLLENQEADTDGQMVEEGGSCSAQ